jgi:hypothetical protein
VPVVPRVDVHSRSQFLWRVPALIKGSCTGQVCFMQIIVIAPHTFASQSCEDFISPGGLVFGSTLEPLVFLMLS